MTFSIYLRWWLPSPRPAASPSPPSGSPALSGVSSAARRSLSGETPPLQRNLSHRWPVAKSEHTAAVSLQVTWTWDQKVLLIRSWAGGKTSWTFIYNYMSAKIINLVIAIHLQAWACQPWASWACVSTKRIKRNDRIHNARKKRAKTMREM